MLNDIEIARKDPQDGDLVSRDKADPSDPLRFDSDPGRDAYDRHRRNPGRP